MENLDIVYLVVKHHFDSGEYPEDYWDYVDTFVGIFDTERQAKKFVDALPLAGEEYTEKTSACPERERNFRNPKSGKTIEYIRYQIIPVMHFY